MKLIDALAAGIRGAEVGSVVLLRRGTSTNATYYTDFEFQQQFSASPIALDSNGSAVLYVNELVDVQVRDANGVLVREFVAGENATSVEVISQSFTGVDYEDGSSGANKPTTLATILDAWKTSAGALDFNVLVNSSSVSLSTALSGSSAFYNVRSYGAVGNGVTDDRAAITAAIAIAQAGGGGIVFFPAGTYRITAAFPLPGNILLMGGGGKSSKLAIDSGASAGILTLPGNSEGQIAGAVGMWFGAINGAAPGIIITASNISTGEFHFADCVFGSDVLTNNSVYSAPATNPTSALKVVFDRCYMKVSAGASSIIAQLGGAARLIIRDCDIVNATAAAATVVAVDDNLLVVGCRFDATANGAAPYTFISYSPGVSNSVVILGNYFLPNTTSVSAVALRNSAAAPASGVFEFGNTFGNPNSATPGCIPYSFATDGYIAFARSETNHGSRYGRVEGLAAVAAANQAVNPKFFGKTLIQRTAGGGLTVDAGTGSMGDEWLLEVYNSTGAPINVVAGTNIIFTGAPFAVGNLGRLFVQLAWLPTGLGTGSWYQTAVQIVN